MTKIRNCAPTWAVVCPLCRVAVARLLSRGKFFVHVGREFFAGELGHYRGAPCILLPRCQVAGSLFDSLILCARVTVAGLISFVGQARLRLPVPARQSLSLLGWVALRLDTSSTLLKHQSIRRTDAAASSHAMKYLPMMYLIEWLTDE